jgi:hypothetical protein
MRSIIASVLLCFSCSMPISQAHAILVTMQCVALHASLDGNRYEDVRARLEEIPVDTSNERELRRRYVRLILPDLGFLVDYGVSLFACVD